MFRKKKSTNTEKEAIEMKEFQLEPRIHFSLPPIPFTFTIPEIQLDSRISPLNIFSNEEQKRTPKRAYENPEEKNETQGIVGQILDDFWISIFYFLDFKSLLFTIFSCKKLAMLANDDAIRTRLYTLNKNKFSELIMSTQTPFNLFQMQPALQHPLAVQPLLAPQIETEYSHHNDNPVGRGFFMK